MDASHPHFVAIPSPDMQGVRAYREPEVPHPLQLAFLDEAEERRWTNEIRDLLSSGQATGADARLTAEIAGFDGALATLCKMTPAAEVTLEGWEDLVPILEEWEGPPITAITLGLTNPADLVFEAGKTHQPDLLISLYSDEAFPFGRSTKAELLAECGKEAPAWIGAEEDVEFYCEIAGLPELNTALIQSKHRRYLRDGRDGVEGRAPGGYVEFVLANWLLATRFLQASELVARRALPDSCRLIVGTVDLPADFVAVLGPDEALAPVTAGRPIREAASIAGLTIKLPPSRDEPGADIADAGSALRQRLISAAPAPVARPPERRGFLARLFGRRARD